MSRNSDICSMPRRLSSRLRILAENYFHWLFPREIEISEFLYQMLEMVYVGKGVEWRLTKFFHGLPWFMHWAGNEASTQPSTYNSFGIHIYYRKKLWAPYTIRGLSTVIHECFHVVQYREVLHGWGIGYFRLFLIPYLSGYALLGRGRRHLIEGPAFAEEDKFRACLERTLAELNIHDPEESFYPRWQEVLAYFKGKCPDISPHYYHIKFWQLMKDMTPGSALWRNKRTAGILAWPWVLVWTAFATSVPIAIALVKPILETILVIPYFLLVFAAGIASLFRR